MLAIDERVLLHIKYFDDAAAAEPDLDGVTSGASLRLVARTNADGRVSVVGSVTHRVHRLRGSGKTFRYWRREAGFSLLRTQRDLVVLRIFDTGGKKVITRHLFRGNTTEIATELRRLDGRFGLHHYDGGRTVRVVEGPAIGTRTQSWLRQISRETLETLIDDIMDLIGDLPVAEERFPLLTDLNGLSLGLAGHTFFLDATDYRQVTANAFGVTRVRRPLVREVERLTRPFGRNFSDNFGILNWFCAFRGLVPIDWIIESMSRTPSAVMLPFKSHELTMVRALLRRVPRPILRRILTEDARTAMHVMRDTVRPMGRPDAQLVDLGLLPELIAARGQKRIRNTRDLENLTRQLPFARLCSPRENRAAATMDTLASEARIRRAMDAYNHSVEQLERADTEPVTWEQWKDPAVRERAEAFLTEYRLALMNAREREQAEAAERYRLKRIERERERATWATELTERVDGLTAGTFRVKVAVDAETLAYWGSVMNNCIGGYAHELGLDVFAAAVDEGGRVRLNVQIQREEGIVQFLGKNNRDAIKELGSCGAQVLLDAFTTAGIPVARHALGTDGLHVPVSA